MTRATLLSTIMAAALFGAPAMAQNNPPAPATPAAPPATTAPAPAATSAPHVTAQKMDQWLASKMPGVDVYNTRDEKIGDISELIINKDGKIDAIVISVGGFLGMGKHDVAVPFAEVKFMDEPPTARTSAPSTTTAPAPTTTGSVSNAPAEPKARAYPSRAVVNMTAEQLKAAPAYKYGG